MRNFEPYTLQNAVNNVFDEVGWLHHLLFNKVVDSAVVYRIVEIVGNAGAHNIRLKRNIYAKIVALTFFLFRNAYWRMKAHII